MILISPFQAIDSTTCSTPQKIVAGCAITSAILSVASTCLSAACALNASSMVLRGKIVSILTRGAYTTVNAELTAPAYYLMAATLFKVALVFAAIYLALAVVQKTIDILIG